ncbi:MAG: diguanylate cyclase [Campylobacterota bacterium]|nr:diguanylate cyclase [Campylobacterota bacterium]
MKLYIKITLVLFFIFALANTVRLDFFIQNLNTIQYEKSEKKLDIIIDDINKISDFIYENIINKPKVIDIFKDAHQADESQKSTIRTKLYELLKDEYATYTKYGIQQLHFHLPNNDSFLRYHKPQKFGDNLSEIRESVKSVNEFKKPVVGFEEGKIFNGYRYVYPLFDNKSQHIGSVEISASLLTFKQIFEKHSDLHLDFIIKNDIIEKKLFASEMYNYKEYQTLKNFKIQSTFLEANEKNCPHPQEIYSFINDIEVQEKIQTIQKYSFYKLINGTIYIAHFMPLLNDFNNEKIGYAIALGELEFVSLIKNNALLSYMIVAVFSILIGFALFIYTYRLKKELATKKLEDETTTDHLTKLKNRKYFYKKFRETINVYKRYKTPFSLILYDIDNFKNINDEHGHKVGDTVLIQMSQLIESIIRESDTLCRIGGEEFTIILPQNTLSDAKESAEKIRLSVEKNLHTILKRPITISMGVAEFNESDTEDTLFIRADKNMYRAKNSGKNKVVAD